MTLTCLSCSHYRTNGCHLGQPGWPTEHLADCWAGQYEPGSDEAEDQTDTPARGDSAGSTTNEDRP